MKWKPIAEMPEKYMDGRSVFLCVAGYVPTVGRYSPEYGWWFGHSTPHTLPDDSLPSWHPFSYRPTHYAKIKTKKLPKSVDEPDTDISQYYV